MNIKLWCVALWVLMPAIQGYGNQKWKDRFGPRVDQNNRHNNATVDPNWNRSGNRNGNGPSNQTLAMGWTVGNGGDWLRIGFARARDHASHIVSRLPEVAINAISNSETREWLSKNQLALAGDILASEHVWYLEAQPTCAWTFPPEAGEPIPTTKPVLFSYPACRDLVISFYEATQLLIHESVHHFGGDETLADNVAIAVMDAWSQGQIDWIATSTNNQPSARQKHSAVWTGDRMIVYGGFDSAAQQSLSDGGIFNPSNNTWDRLNISGGGERYFHDAHWTGEEMLVWGGYTNNGSTATWRYDGFLWNPQTGNVTQISNPGWNPQSSTWTFDPRQKTAWTGDKLVVWGGIDQDGLPIGGIFDPKTKQWDDMVAYDSEAPRKIAGHSVTWVGDNKVVVWGGYEGVSGSDRNVSNSGAIYDIGARSWSTMPDSRSSNVPSKRAGHQAIWSGTKLFVFSGGGVSSQRQLTSTGGLFDLSRGEWTTEGAEMVMERVGHTVTWNGFEALVYGGKSNRLRTYFSEVFRFNPDNKRWAGVSSRFRPESRWYHSAVWTGSSLIIWGGNQGATTDVSTGGIYYP